MLEILCFLTKVVLVIAVVTWTFLRGKKEGKNEVATKIAGLEVEVEFLRKQLNLPPKLSQT